jgi:hypothetical protein
LTRIRKALDSDPVRSEMDDRFDGNRLFFGRYTSKTGVTGFHKHPRKNPSDHYKKKRRKLRELYRLSKSMQKTQREARRLAENGEVDEEVPFLFPSVDGGELTSRWDMQATPPDILITNITMLSAMLAREVDAPILDQTRNWLLGNEDAYFYLILDELHLQRGSAGTEVSFLLRLLFERLGLTNPDHRHKLKILSSSASMPMEGYRREESLEYLWDMFGQHGTWKEDGTTSVSGSEEWSGSVVTGQRVDANPGNDHHLEREAFRDLLNVHLDEEKAVAELVHPQDHKKVWRKVAENLLGKESDGDLTSLVYQSVEEAESRVSNVCREADGEEIRPKRVSWVAEQLFGDADPEARKALRGLFLVRAAGDKLSEWWPGRDFEDPDQSFRLHTFFRSVEGLFASVGDQDRLDEKYQNEERIVGPLSVERGVRFSGGDGEGLGNRKIELLYCESCGDLYFGGMRGGSSESTEVELLPSEPDLEALPDEAAQQLFETLSHEDYAIFWPTDRNDTTGETEAGNWLPGKYDPKTGQVFRQPPSSVDENELVDGYLYYREEGLSDHHGRGADDPGTAVPYECPSCGTSYYFRPAQFRLSPIRNFRAGFAKTTQLLATEVYDLLRLDTENAKLVSFSDSRQDAAKAALDIESRRHGDLYREILVETLREEESGSGDPAQIEKKIDQIKEQIEDAAHEGELERLSELNNRREELRDSLEEAFESSVPLSKIVEDDEQREHYNGIHSDRSRLKPLISKFVNLGVHPSDPSGTRKIKGGEIGDSGEHEWYEWVDLFCERDGQKDWQDNEVNQRLVDPARDRVVRNVLRQVTDVVFSKRHFSLEETGLGYPCVPKNNDERSVDGRVLDAFLRVLGDAYRMRDNPWITSREDLPKEWRVENDIPDTNRIRRFGEAIWGNDAPHHLQSVLDELHEEGHKRGLIFTPQLRFQLVGEEDPYWRCDSCGRVHLHRGAGTCTRCFARLPRNQEGVAGSLRDRSYLAKRVERHGEPFRLRCEELTGQTDNPSERQRRFKNIILKEEREIDDLTKASRLIDLLAVTTTMEVGIDIGPLRSIFQANMPPRRFNYQQRVGRSGRRGKAFSFALTVCRNKSHDLHYFRHPESITGDDPPPPFLTKTQPNGAKRFVRKAWLSEAFRRVRDEFGAEYPGDEIQDIHGEYVPYNEYFDGEKNWKERLRSKLWETRDYRDRIIEVVTTNSPLEENQEIHDLGVETLLDELDELEDTGTPKKGLAETFAEEGFLPMYGLPTRVRNLYTDHEQQKDGSDWRTWSTIDRDLDIAIQEFSPGSTLVKDKRQHRCVGFTGPLPNFIKYQNELTPFGPAFSDPFWLAQCEVCGAWRRLDTDPNQWPKQGIDCASCGNIVDLERSVECRVPNGFRTDFRPKSLGRERLQSKRYRSTTAEGEAIEFTSRKSNLSFSVQSQTRTYRLNRGGEQQGDEEDGFTAIRGTHSLENYDLEEQYIAPEYIGEDGSSLEGFQPSPGEEGEGRVENVWLAAPKTTDSLFLAPSSVPKDLRITEVGMGERRKTAARAAAISATYIVVNRASLELDIDPEEFDVVEPRLYSPDGERNVPILQITDHLVNGAGFCERLGKLGSNDVPLVEELVHSILSEEDEYPLSVVLRQDSEIDHLRECDSACYHCLHRYSNQMYHGLLDWRLGLAFLRVLYDESYRCGLDGNFRGPAISDWKRRAKTYAEDVLRFHSSGELQKAGSLWAFTPDKSSNRWAIIVHPLWDREEMPEIVEEAWRSLDSPGVNIAFTDTFELSRRQLQERERLRKEWNKL